MLKIDNSLLEEVGLAALPDPEKNSFLKHIYETLEMRVGIRLADQMTNEQLDEFERYFEAKDDAGAFKWLETNFPNYKDIVQQEFDKLKAEVASTAPQILAASQTQTGQTPSVPAPTTGINPDPTLPAVPNSTLPSSISSQPYVQPMSSTPQALPAEPQFPQPPQPPAPPTIPPPTEPPLPYVPEPSAPPQAVPSEPSISPPPVDSTHTSQVPPFPEQQPPAGPPAA